MASTSGQCASSSAKWSMTAASACSALERTDGALSVHRATSAVMHDTPHACTRTADFFGWRLDGAGVASSSSSFTSNIIACASVSSSAASSSSSFCMGVAAPSSFCMGVAAPSSFVASSSSSSSSSAGTSNGSAKCCSTPAATSTWVPHRAHVPRLSVLPPFT